MIRPRRNGKPAAPCPPRGTMSLRSGEREDLLVIGGRDRVWRSFQWGDNTDIVEVYDPAIDQWGPLRQRMPQWTQRGGLRNL